MRHIEENVREYETACTMRADRWVVACGGTETPIRYPDGRVYVYVFNPATGKHGWLDTGTDMVRMDHPGM
jgi:hypothetical protein